MRVRIYTVKLWQCLINLSQLYCVKILIHLSVDHPIVLYSYLHILTLYNPYLFQITIFLTSKSSCKCHVCCVVVSSIFLILWLTHSWLVKIDRKSWNIFVWTKRQAFSAIFDGILGCCAHAQSAAAILQLLI